MASQMITATTIIVRRRGMVSAKVVNTISLVDTNGGQRMSQQVIGMTAAVAEEPVTIALTW
jgi:hypothetical protein